MMALKYLKREFCLNWDLDSVVHTTVCVCVCVCARGRARACTRDFLQLHNRENIKNVASYLSSNTTFQFTASDLFIMAEVLKFLLCERSTPVSRKERSGIGTDVENLALFKTFPFFYEKNPVPV